MSKFSFILLKKLTIKLIETLNNFECHHLQNDFCCENNLNQRLEALLFYLALLLILLLLLALSALSTNPAIADLLTNSFYFILASNISRVNLLESDVANYLDSI